MYLLFMLLVINLDRLSLGNPSLHPLSLGIVEGQDRDEALVFWVFCKKADIIIV
jgi:hypothetical protein